MIKPEFLKKGDSVAVVSPAGFVDKKTILDSIDIITSWGLNVEIGKNIFNKHGIFAGTDEERTTDLQKAIDNKEIKAIFFSRGGYGCARILEKIDFSSLTKNPKWIVGFSDITVFHSYLNKHLRLESLHSVMPGNFSDNKSVLLLKNALFGEKIKYELPANQYNVSGNCSANIVGGNLSVLYSLRGTKYDLNYNNKILFIEDIGEYYYHLDRMLMNFKLGEIFKNIKGLIIGGMNDMKDGNSEYQKDTYQIISEYVKGLKIPVFFDFPAGHIKTNYPLILGRKVKMNVSESSVSIIF